MEGQTGRSPPLYAIPRVCRLRDLEVSKYLRRGDVYLRTTLVAYLRSGLACDEPIRRHENILKAPDFSRRTWPYWTPF